ncbi:RNA-guided endonuclease InsQ/TnpB family protein [Gloeocapsopsis dulcis]|uniref:Transposase n=1 Tax=Gloeocapsopsis dulcis AAB1 = 1H9 TaxID=1433147 RepID=A0A6N8G199_9CHRO|nr:RNA-guided endonuclease TnpB family protein [Gloeocapsopsis dulcis]MUL39103.1 transposase [Gloeocapsopsis dulcis AAB1 = 1H9]WNN88641.1 RNA-guided endonuclease TnpB family protein [Gloeocapsopsis dulcis]
MLKVVKIRIYPTKEQEISLAKSFGCTRWLWNRFLAQNNEVYKETGKGLSRYDYQKQLPKLKKEFDWIKETYSQCLQVVCLNLSRAFINFFEGRARYPKFKSKHGRQSISYPQNVLLQGDYLKVPKIGDIYALIHREITGKLKTVTISKNPDNKHYACLLLEDDSEEIKPSTEGKAIGLDLGLTDFVVTSDNSKIKQPLWMKQRERNLKRKQQKLARKVEGSKSREKARVLVAKTHSKVARCRGDFLHKLSRKIVNENQVIVVEDLHVKGMVCNPNLSSSISQVGWGTFCTMLKYKAEQEGKVYLEVNRYFPSSKTCHVCLNVVDSLPLDVRSWTCSCCNTNHDRDVNAAINIRNEGLRILASGTGVTAEGGCVSPKRGRKKSTVGQQPVNSEAYAIA